MRRARNWIFVANPYDACRLLTPIHGTTQPTKKRNAPSLQLINSYNSEIVNSYGNGPHHIFATTQYSTRAYHFEWRQRLIKNHTHTQTNTTACSVFDYETELEETTGTHTEPKPDHRPLEFCRFHFMGRFIRLAPKNIAFPKRERLDNPKCK